MSTAKLILVVGIYLSLVGLKCSAADQGGNQQGKSAISAPVEILGLISSLSKAGDSVDRNNARKMLRNSKPKTGAEIKALIGVAQEPEIGGDAIQAIRSIDSTAAKEVSSEMVEQINVADDTTELRVLRAIVDVNVRNKFPGAKEQIRARLNREPKTTIRQKSDKESLWKNNWNKGKQIGRVQILAEALAKLDGPAAIDTLFGLDEVMASGQAGRIVAPLGVSALNRAIKDFQKESGLRQEGCLEIIAFSTSPEAVPILEQQVASNDSKVRRAATTALVRANAPNIDEVLEKMRKDADPGIRRYAEDTLHRRHPENYKQELIDALSGHGAISCTAALGILAENPVKGTEEALEQFIRRDEKENRHSPKLRFFAAKSLWKLTGRKIEYDRGLASYEKYPWE